MGLNATLEVSNSSLSGDSGSSSTDETLDVLKQIRDELSKNTKLQQTGFINGIGGLGGGGIARLLGGLGGTVLAGASALALTGDQRQGTQQTGYDAGIKANGEQVYFEIDNKTGEILRTLTKQQVEDEGILNSKGKIKDNLKVQNKDWMDVTKKIGRVKDLIDFTNDDIYNISVETSKQFAIQQAITKALQKQYKQIDGKTFKQMYDDARYQETGQVQNSDQANSAFQQIFNNTIYPGGLSPSQAIAASYFSQRANESSNFQDAQRLIRNQMPLVDATVYIPVGR